MAKPIEYLVEEAYKSKHVQRVILENARKLGTTKRIEDGELSLPGNEDAERFAEFLAIDDDFIDLDKEELLKL